MPSSRYGRALPASNAFMHDREGCIRNRSEDNGLLISTAPTFEFIGDRATRRNRLPANVQEVIMSPVSIPRTFTE